MKLSEFKEAILDRLWLIKANTVYTFLQETAYWANNWGSILSTGLYTFAVILFIQVVYANVKTVVGYDRNEMFFFLFVGQLAVFANYAVSFNNIQDLIEDVRQGNLDLILTKPVPALFYVTFKRIRLVSMVRDGLIPIFGPALMIKWSELHFSPGNLFVGTIILCMGVILLHVLQFLAASAVFWLGESKFPGIISSLDQNAGRTIPLEGFDFSWRMVLGVVVPVLIPTGFSVSVMLGKSDSVALFLWAFMVTVVALYIRDIVWQLALRSYTSASS